jgi:hypothetical protein
MPEYLERELTANLFPAQAAKTLKELHENQMIAGKAAGR